MEPVDVSKKHFYISIVKSAFRIAAGFCLFMTAFTAAGVLFIVAEILGIAEEL
tara:strand:- start:5135 stop:5293 length:159 start_codon:yes stop_codon:yes gene_type:complete